MYEFQPRVPLDYGIELWQILSGKVERDRGDVLILIGAMTGEIGALVKQGLVSINEVNLQSACPNFTNELSVDEQVEVLGTTLEKIKTEKDTNPNFDPTPWIPIILKLIELWLSRR